MPVAGATRRGLPASASGAAEFDHRVGAGIVADDAVLLDDEENVAGQHAGIGGEQHRVTGRLPAVLSRLW